MGEMTPVRLEPGALPADWEALPEVPARRYTDPAFAEAERERLWKTSWLCAGRESELPEPGSYKLFEKTGVPIVLVRGKDGEVRAFYNICRHRGARVAREETGRASLLRCQFHSWSYTLKGELAGVPGKEGFACLDAQDRNLVPVRCARWAGWLFVNLDDEGQDFADFIAAFDDQLRSTDMASLRLIGKRSYVARSNWKTVMDAFVEAYHLDTIHPKTAAVVNDSRYSRIELLPGGHSWQSLRRKKPLGDEMVLADQPNIAGIDDHFREYGITYNIFPNLVAPIDPIGFPVLFMWPIDTTHSQIEVYFLAPEWESDGREAFYEQYFRFFDQLIDEDMDNLANIQVALGTGVMAGPLLGYQEQRVYWLHQAIDDRIGVERIPEDQRVAQVLHAG